MQWGSLSNFLAMGGHAFFVWGAYAVTLVVIAAEIAALRGRRRRALAEARREAARAGSAA